MIKWLVYIVFLLVAVPCILSAKAKGGRAAHAIVQIRRPELLPVFNALTDTIKNKSAKADLKVKDVPKAKKQPKPEKVDDADAKKEKPKRQKRPDGMERPPEIPRRNDN